MSDADRIRWRMVVESLSRPYPVSISMIVLVSLVPFYIFIAELSRERTLHVPELAWDRAVPLQPGWTERRFLVSRLTGKTVLRARYVHMWRDWSWLDRQPQA